MPPLLSYIAIFALGLLCSSCAYWTQERDMKLQPSSRGVDVFCLESEMRRVQDAVAIVGDVARELRTREPVNDDFTPLASCLTKGMRTNRNFGHHLQQA